MPKEKGRICSPLSKQDVFEHIMICFDDLHLICLDDLLWFVKRFIRAFEPNWMNRVDLIVTADQIIDQLREEGKNEK